MRSFCTERHGSVGSLPALGAAALLSSCVLGTAQADTLYLSDGDPFGLTASPAQGQGTWNSGFGVSGTPTDPRSLLGLRWDQDSRTARQLGYRQSFLDDRFALSLGRIEGGSGFDANWAPLIDQTRFAGGPAFQNSAPLASTSFIEDLAGQEEGVYRAELGIIQTIPGLGDSVLRVSRQLGSGLDAGGTGAGYAFSLEQETPYNASAWLSAGSQVLPENQGSRPFVSGGVVFDSPFGLEGDEIGVSLGWAQSKDGRRGGGVLLESFWTFNLTDEMSLTPDVQFHADPAYGPEDPPVSTIGVLHFDLKF
ncbi:MAG: hypothetical protein QNJ92_05410 [Alphaproteobacteria bacterium]|nr:hypothetical protein [Alphaproteobacteria bacterium]